MGHSVESEYEIWSEIERSEGTRTDWWENWYKMI